MLRLPSFQLVQAETVAEAAQALADHGPEARIVAGGTDLWPNMKRRHQRASTVVSLAKLSDLHGVKEENGELRIGAMTTLSEIVDDETVGKLQPSLRRAVQSISSPVLRNMGTIGGNLCLDTRCTYYNQNEEWRQSISYCMKEEGETCWVAPGSPRCWAISASDSAPMLCALDARVRLVSAEGDREIPLTELYNDDGIAYLTKRPDEILVEVIVPKPGDEKTAYWKLRRRGSIDFAVLTVAPSVIVENGIVTESRIFMGAVGSFPIRVHEAEKVLVGKPLDADTIAEAARVARKDGTPLNNTDFIPQWRSRMIERYLEASLRECAGLATERLSPQHGFGL
ncbi:MAG: FAD binding domain-containing protein [Planctomycetota bacterium]